MIRITPTQNFSIEAVEHPAEFLAAVIRMPDILINIVSRRVDGMRYLEKQLVCKLWRKIIKKYAPVKLAFRHFRSSLYESARISGLLEWEGAISLSINDEEKELKARKPYDALFCQIFLTHVARFEALECLDSINVCSRVDWSNLAKLPRLRSIRLHGVSNLDGVGQLSGLRSLHTLDLLDVELKGIPDEPQFREIALLSNLRVLLMGAHFEYNGEALTALQHLEVLDFSSRSLTDLLEVVNSKAPLRKLTITEPGTYTGRGIDHFSSSLEKLRISHNLEHVDVRFLVVLTKLRSLELGRLPGFDVQMFRCPELRTLRCVEALSREVRDHLLKYSPKLRTLEAIAPSFMENSDLQLLCGFTALRKLWLGPCPNLSKGAIDYFAQLSSLKCLRLDGFIASKNDLLMGLPHVPVIVTEIRRTNQFLWTVTVVRPEGAPQTIFGEKHVRLRFLEFPWL